jgi:hypothetical protein
MGKQTPWTPVFTGVTTFSETIKVNPSRSRDSRLAEF